MMGLGDDGVNKDCQCQHVGTATGRYALSGKRLVEFRHGLAVGLPLVGCIVTKIAIMVDTDKFFECFYFMFIIFAVPLWHV